MAKGLTAEKSKQAQPAANNVKGNSRRVEPSGGYNGKKKNSIYIQMETVKRKCLLRSHIH